jgi:hypothetical protein
MKLNVIFEDSSQTIICGWFADPQETSIWPNFSQIEDTDQRWANYFNGLPDSVKSTLPHPA